MFHSCNDRLFERSLRESGHCVAVQLGDWPVDLFDVAAGYSKGESSCHTFNRSQLQRKITFKEKKKKQAHSLLSMIRTLLSVMHDT